MTFHRVVSMGDMFLTSLFSFEKVEIVDFCRGFVIFSLGCKYVLFMVDSRLLDKIASVFYLCGLRGESVGFWFCNKSWFIKMLGEPVGPDIVRRAEGEPCCLFSNKFSFSISETKLAYGKIKRFCNKS